MSIYFIRAGKTFAIKIGEAQTHTIAQRLINLQIANHQPLKLLALIEPGYFTERDIHKRFAELRIRAEWFWLRDDLVEFLAELPPARLQYGDWVPTIVDPSILEKHKITAPSRRPVLRLRVA